MLFNLFLRLKRPEFKAYHSASASVKPICLHGVRVGNWLDMNSKLYIFRTTVARKQQRYRLTAPIFEQKFAVYFGYRQ